MTPRDYFEAENSEPLLQLPMDPQYQETGAWGCVLGLALTVLTIVGAVLVISALRSLE